MEIQNSQQKELLQERITDQEVRALLERLGQSQLGGPEEATVGAVVEATGAQPLEVGRLLAEIRQEDLEKRFTDTFGDHEERIEKLEVTPPRVVERSSPGYALEPEQLAYLDRMTEREARGRAAVPWVILIMVVLVVIAFATAQSRFPQTPPRMDWGYGNVEHWTDGTYRVRNPDGTYRDATDEEMIQASPGQPKP